MLAVRCPESTHVVESTVILAPNLALAPSWKSEPKMSTFMVVPRAPVVGETEVGFGAGSMVRHPVHEPELVSGLVIVTFRTPTGAFEATWTRSGRSRCSIHPPPRATPALPGPGW